MPNDGIDQMLDELTMSKPTSTELITDEINTALLANWTHGQDERRTVSHDPVPVMRLHGQLGPAEWLITERSTNEPDILFGLCDLGMGFPEIGYVSLSELKSVAIAGAFKIVREVGFTATFPISVYAQAARLNSGITHDEKTLLQAKAVLDAERKRGGSH